MERASETPRPEARPAHANSIGETSSPAPLTASAMALRDLCADGLGEEPRARHRVVLWISVMSVKLDHPDVDGDIERLFTRDGLHSLWCKLVGSLLFDLRGGREWLDSPLACWPA